VGLNLYFDDCLGRFKNMLARKSPAKQLKKFHLYDQFRRYNYIYIHIPKTGGISVSKRLMGFAVGHKSISEYFANDPFFSEKAFKFSLVRHPFTRFRSTYFYLVNGGMNLKDQNLGRELFSLFPTFECFCDGIGSDDFMQIYSICVHLRHQYKFLVMDSRPGSIAMSYVGRLEALDEFWEVVSSCVPLLPTRDPGVMNSTHYSMPDVRQASLPQSQSSFPERLVSKVCDFYEKDMCLFSYNSSDWIL
jgi:hypothetical protein